MKLKASQQHKFLQSFLQYVLTVLSRKYCEHLHLISFPSTLWSFLWGNGKVIVIFPDDTIKLISGPKFWLFTIAQ